MTVDLPVVPPLPPMLARLTRELPEGDFSYEPKWDGFRAIAFRDGGEVEIRSRHDRPLARYFPEVLRGLVALSEPRLVLDGEIVLPAQAGRSFDFAALMSRLHPAPSRVARLSAEAPGEFIVFDLLAVGDDDLRETPFSARRERLEGVLAAAPPSIRLTPATRDLAVARDWFERFGGGGVDGIVAKAIDAPYEPGRRAMLKVKRERAAECVLAGVRLIPGRRTVSSLLLGLYDLDGDLRHVGVVTQLPSAERAALIDELRPLVMPLADHPWRNGFLIGRSPLGRLKGSAARWTPDMEHDWVPLRLDRVVEVAFDQVDVDRFRHPARFLRWRPDRVPASCSLDQILPAHGGPEIVLGRAG